MRVNCTKEVANSTSKTQRREGFIRRVSFPAFLLSVAAFVLLLGLLTHLFAEETRLGAGAKGAGNQLELTAMVIVGTTNAITYYADSNGHYYLLKSGAHPEALDRAEKLMLSPVGADQVAIINGSEDVRFFAIEKIPLANPLDMDNDGIDDVYELERAHFLNPLFAGDANLDQDSDGYSNKAEYDQNSDPEDPLSPDFNPLVIREIEPANGEDMVSPTRHVVVRFGIEIDPATLNTNTIHLLANSKPVPGRVVVSSTGLFATFIPDAPLPPSTEIRVYNEGDGILAAVGLPLDFDGNGQPGGQVVTYFRTLPLTRIPGTKVWGYVKDSVTDAPLEGVTIRVDAFPSANAVTDATGYFELIDVPAPDFFVHIDGSTAFVAPGKTYPNVGKPFHSVAGQSVQISHHGTPFDIYLPEADVSDFQQVSMTDPTEIGFGPGGKVRLQQMLPGIDPSSWERTKLILPPNSAVDESMNPVPTAALFPVDASRLPAPLPSHLDHILDVSIQAPGATLFDVPPAVAFPNVGALAPEESALIMSFDHGSGRWRVVGPATTTADGMSVISDPGVGMVAPGWHGINPGDDTMTCQDVNVLYAVQLLQGALSCASEAKDISKKSNQLIDGALATYDAYKAAIITLDAVIAPDSDNSAYCAAIENVRILKSQLISQAHDAHKVRQQALVIAISCINELQSATQEHCQLAFEEGCVPDWQVNILAALCALNDAMLLLLETTKNAIVLLDNKLSSALVYALGVRSCNDLGKMASDLGCPAFPNLSNRAPMNGAKASGFDHTLARAQFSQYTNNYLEVLDEFGTTAGTASDSISNLLEGVEELESILVPYVDQALPATAGFYVYDFEGSSVRGRTDLSGVFGEVLPAFIDFQITIYDPASHRVGIYTSSTAASGSQTLIPTIRFEPDRIKADTDGDGLSDNAEHAIGTSANNIDTDADGLSDFEEVKADLDPLSGLLPSLGMLALSDLDGNSVDVSLSVIDGLSLAFVSVSQLGVQIVDISEPLRPVELGLWSCDGASVTDVGIDPVARRGAAACNSAGLRMFDLSDDMLPVSSVGTFLDASRVEVQNGIAYANDNTELVSVDMQTGLVIHRLNLTGSGRITDLSLAANKLYVMDSNRRLHVVSVDSFFTEEEGAIDLSQGAGRIRAGDGYVYCAASSHGPGGHVVVDVNDPANPVLVSNSDVPSAVQSSRAAIVPNGSGLGLRVGPTFNGNSVELVSLRQPTNTHDFITSWEMPGIPHNAAIAAGMGYVAVGNAGLAVVNYAPFDIDGVPPSGVLYTTATSGVVVAGSRQFVCALVEDDVQVRDVDFFLNGEFITTDIDFPFEFPWTIDSSLVGSQVVLTATATDTGGNSTDLAPISYVVSADTNAPVVAILSPTNNAGVFSGEGILLELSAFDEVGIEEVTVLLNGEIVETRRVSLFQYVFSAPSDYGTNQITVIATDFSGNISNIALSDFYIRKQAVSREMTVFNMEEVEPLNAISREVTVFNNGLDEPLNAVSREWSVFNAGEAERPNAVSREWSIFNTGETEKKNAVSREISVENTTP